jgi:quercetin dioxygenase-like cupin family protein
LRLGDLAGENPNPEKNVSRKGAKYAKFGEKGEEKMSLQVKRENVPEKKVVLKTGEGEGSMIIRQAFGNESSLLVALRPPGYHTRPHMHASEQINHVLEGEIWFFVEDRGYHCLKGDFHRIPANRVHWAWNRSNATTAVVESHSPPLVGGELRGGGSLRELIQADSARDRSRHSSGPGGSRVIDCRAEAAHRSSGLLPGQRTVGKTRRQRLDRATQKIVL